MEPELLLKLQEQWQTGYAQGRRDAIARLAKRVNLPTLQERRQRLRQIAEESEGDLANLAILALIVIDFVEYGE